MLTTKSVAAAPCRDLSAVPFGALRVSVGRVPQCAQPLTLASCASERLPLRQSTIAHAAPSSSQQAAPPRAYKKKVKKLVDMNGEVVKDLGNAMFQLKLENGVKVIAHLSGRIRQAKIKILLGDAVTVELSPYDLTRGRITYRFKAGELEARKAAAEAGKAAAAAAAHAEAMEA